MPAMENCVVDSECMPGNIILTLSSGACVVEVCERIEPTGAADAEAAAGDGGETAPIEAAPMETAPMETASDVPVPHPDPNLSSEAASAKDASAEGAHSTAAPANDASGDVTMDKVPARPSSLDAALRTHTHDNAQAKDGTSVNMVRTSATERSYIYIYRNGACHKLYDSVGRAVFLNGEYKIVAAQDRFAIFFFVASCHFMVVDTATSDILFNDHILVHKDTAVPFMCLPYGSDLPEHVRDVARVATCGIAGGRLLASADEFQFVIADSGYVIHVLYFQGELKKPSLVLRPQIPTGIDIVPQRNKFRPCPGMLYVFEQNAISACSLADGRFAFVPVQSPFYRPEDMPTASKSTPVDTAIDQDTSMPDEPPGSTSGDAQFAAMPDSPPTISRESGSQPAPVRAEASIAAGGADSNSCAADNAAMQAITRMLETMDFCDTQTTYDYDESKRMCSDIILSARASPHGFFVRTQAFLCTYSFHRKEYLTFFSNVQAAIFFRERLYIFFNQAAAAPSLKDTSKDPNGAAPGGSNALFTPDPQCGDGDQAMNSDTDNSASHVAKTATALGRAGVATLSKAKAEGPEPWRQYMEQAEQECNVYTGVNDGFDTGFLCCVLDLITGSVTKRVYFPEIEDASGVDDQTTAVCSSSVTLATSTRQTVFRVAYNNTLYTVGPSYMITEIDRELAGEAQEDNGTAKRAKHVC